MNASTVIVDQLREASFVKREALFVPDSEASLLLPTLHEERTCRILSVVDHYDVSPFCSSGPLKCGPAGTDKGCTTKDLRRYACYLRSHRSKQFWHGCQEVRVVDSFDFQGGIGPCH
jgi:hypothetical protein